MPRKKPTTWDTSNSTAPTSSSPLANSSPGSPKKEDDNSLERAEAIGDAVIVKTSPGRTRRGVSERADYDVPAARIVLTGGSPQMFDSLKGNTKGERLTWFSNEDRLLVDGSTAQPAASRILKKR